MLTVETSRSCRCELACLRHRHEHTHSDDLTQSAPEAHCSRAPSSAATFLKNTFFCLVQSPRPPRERQSALDGTPANTTVAAAVRHIRRRQPHAAHTSNSCFLHACTPAVGKAQQAYPRAPNFNVERRPKSRDKTILHLQHQIFRSYNS